MPSSVHTDAYKAMLSGIVAARQSAGLTQVEVAQRLGKPQSYVSKLERGERRVDLVELVELSHALGLEPKSFASDLIGHIADHLEKTWLK